MSKRITVTVEAEVWLDEIETSDLAEELSKRGDLSTVNAAKVITVPPLNGEDKHPLHDIFYAFKAGLTDRATELARAYVCDELGVVL